MRSPCSRRHRSQGMGMHRVPASDVQCVHGAAVKLGHDAQHAWFARLQARQNAHGKPQVAAPFGAPGGAGPEPDCSGQPFWRLLPPRPPEPRRGCLAVHSAADISTAFRCDNLAAVWHRQTGVSGLAVAAGSSAVASRAAIISYAGHRPGVLQVALPTESVAQLLMKTRHTAAACHCKGLATRDSM